MLEDMPIRPPTHRAAGQARRAALLDAAVEVLAEVGLGGATHRAVAIRAGVPLSTTSYFFASIDDLIAEAMQVGAGRLIARIDEVVEGLVGGAASADEVITQLVGLVGGARSTELAAQFEVYLQGARRPELQSVVHQVMAGFERAAEVALRAAGVPRPWEAARAVVALLDGFALHRVAWPRGGADRVALEAGVRALLAGFLAAAPTSEPAVSS